MIERVLIIDDEALARSRIRRFLEELNAKAQVQEADSGITALSAIATFSPDLLLLDIQMPGLSGLEMLNQVEQRDFAVVFQTAFDQFAVDAFEQNACDYLLKPFTKERFAKALEKAHRDLRSLERVEKAFQKRDGYLDKVSVKHRGIIQLIPTKSISHFRSEDHCTLLFSSEGEFVCDLSLNHLEKRLAPQNFLRCHRSAIVATQQVAQILPGENMQIALICGAVLPVARAKRAAIKSLSSPD